MKRALISSVFLLGASSAAADTDWTGFYAGLQYVSPNAEFFEGSDQDDVPFSDTAGVFLGYDHDFGKFVLGGELTYNKFDDDGAVVGETEHYQLRARLGADLGATLTYVTVGATKAELLDAPGGVDARGLTYGIGAEYLVNEKFSVGFEYSLNKLDEVKTLPDVEVNVDLLQLRASYRF